MLTPEGYEKIQGKIAKPRKLATRAVTLMEAQLKRGGEVAQEWPRHNKGWKFKVIEDFWHKIEHHEAYADGCAFGLKAPCGGLIKKPWRLRARRLHAASGSFTSFVIVKDLMLPAKVAP